MSPLQPYMHAVHPRLRGELLSTKRDILDVLGSSPLARGTPFDIRLDRIALANLGGAVTLCLPLPAGRLKGYQLQEVEHPQLMKVD